MVESDASGMPLVPEKSAAPSTAIIKFYAPPANASEKGPSVVVVMPWHPLLHPLQMKTLFSDLAELVTSWENQGIIPVNSPPHSLPPPGIPLPVGKEKLQEALDVVRSSLTRFGPEDENSEFIPVVEQAIETILSLHPTVYQFSEYTVETLSSMSKRLKLIPSSLVKIRSS